MLKVLVLAGILALGFWLATAHADQRLVPGWNNVEYRGETIRSPTVVFRSQPAKLAWWWNADRQSWLGWFADGIDNDDLPAFVPNNVYWIYMTDFGTMRE